MSDDGSVLARLCVRKDAMIERITKERDAIALMWFRELADTPKGEERLYDLVGPDIYTGVDDGTAIEAARKAAGLTEGPR